MPPSQTNSSDDASCLLFQQEDSCRILQILGDAEGVIRNDSCLEDMLLSFEPRPIGPAGDFLDHVMIMAVPPQRPSSSLLTKSLQEDCSEFFHSDSLTWLLRHNQQQTSNAPPFVCSASASQDDEEDDFEPISYGRSTTRSSRSSSGSTTSSATGPSITKSSETDGENTNCFRSYQQDQWTERFQDLCRFKKTFGHVLVPHNFPQCQHLAQWVKRQRYQYKLKQMGRHSTLTDDRLEALESVGFVWDSHQAGWLEKLEELKAFKMQFGHTNVPTNYPERSLAIWVKCQRRQMKLCLRAQKSTSATKPGGPSSTMTRERCLALEELGFDWNPRKLQL